MKPSGLVVSPAPHCHCGARVTGHSYSVLLALLPATIMGCVLYGADAIGVIGLSVSAAMLSEAVMQKLFKKPISIADGTAATSGLVLALILPAGTPAHVVIVASALGIAIGKQCFGGLGANPLNPALVGWAMARISNNWAGYLDFDLALANADPGFAIQYPLGVLKAASRDGHVAEALAQFPLKDLALGLQTGGIGAAATLCLFLGGMFLVLRGNIRWELPVFFFVGLCTAACVFGKWVVDAEQVGHYALFHVLTGNAMMAAFFFCADHATTPVNRKGMILYGLGCGALTVVFRVWSNYPDGAVFATLLMSLWVPLLDKIGRRQFVPRPMALPVAKGGEA